MKEKVGTESKIPQNTYTHTHIQHSRILRCNSSQLTLLSLALEADLTSRHSRSGWDYGEAGSGVVEVRDKDIGKTVVDYSKVMKNKRAFSFNIC